MAIDMAARIAAAKAAKADAEAKISDDDKAEIEAREELATIDAERVAIEKQRRELDLARRFDAAREQLGEDALIESVAIEGREDTFIVQCDAKAHSKWEKELAEAATNKKLDKTEVSRNYAVAVVIDWNGITDFGPTSLNGRALIEHLKKNPGMVSPLVNAGARLAGFFAEARKS